jgi:hypothetical protein
MEDKELLETIERYLTDDMSSQERTQFEALRKNTPEIDQMVVEHKLFLDHMQLLEMLQYKRTPGQGGWSGPRLP